MGINTLPLFQEEGGRKQIFVFFQDAILNYSIYPSIFFFLLSQEGGPGKALCHFQQKITRQAFKRALQWN